MSFIARPQNLLNQLSLLAIRNIFSKFPYVGIRNKTAGAYTNYLHKCLKASSTIILSGQVSKQEMLMLQSATLKEKQFLIIADPTNNIFVNKDSNNEIKTPAVVILYNPGQELLLLKQMDDVIKAAKPIIIFDTGINNSTDHIIETIKYLSNINYSGFFLLEDTAIPVRNFDSEIYQNPNRNFFCTKFIFEPIM